MARETPLESGAGRTPADEEVHHIHDGIFLLLLAALAHLGADALEVVV